jgi:hypothetical protein
VDLVDPPGEPPQRLGIGRDGELVEVLSVLLSSYSDSPAASRASRS